MSRRVHSFVERLLRDRRPRRFSADDDEARAMLAAAALRSGRPGTDAPRPEFVENLARRLAEQMRSPDSLAGVAGVTRRRLLRSAAVAAAAAAVGAGVDRTVEWRIDQGAAGPAAELVPRRGDWMDVAAVEDVPVGRPLRFSAGAIEGFVVNHGDRFQAVSAICTHLPCSLQLNSTAQRLDCPCHGAWFGFDGQPISSAYYADSLPALPTVRTRVSEGRIQVFSA